MKDLETQSEEYAWGRLCDATRGGISDRIAFLNVAYFTGDDIQDAYEAGYDQAIKDMQSGGNKEE